MSNIKKKPTHIILGDESTIEYTYEPTTNDKFKFNIVINNDPVSLDNKEWWGHRTKNLTKECSGVFEKMKLQYEKDIVRFPKESIWLKTIYNQTKKYIDETYQLFDSRIVNGFPPNKIPRDIELLPAYEEFLEWLEDKKKG